ncbi:MAG: 23S rRNA (uracil(1939)-C(5))-methyltransferase RlmD [Lachnospiraceae bacterium]|nr:23S rRNA (uracil(1939)-C(5))-methyltransferase RlmD [Lachnospiraceae bacterium]
MKKGEVYEGIVKEIRFPNKTVIEVPTDDGVETVIAKNGVVGQKVCVRVTKKRKGKAEGQILEVLEKSSLEMAPDCPHFGDCGGCVYRNLPYDRQLELKESQVRKLIDGVYINSSREMDYVFEGILGSPQETAYRNKMEFSFGDEYFDGPLSVGLHKRGSFYDIVPVTECKIVDEDYRKILSLTLDFFREREIPFYHRMKKVGYLRHLLVRKAVKTGEILVALVTTSQTEVLTVDEKQLLSDYTTVLLQAVEQGEMQGRFAGIIHTVNDAVADVVQSDRNETLYGRDFFYEELLGLKFKISQFSFFQTNSLGAEVLYEKVREYADLFTKPNSGLHNDKPLIFDLYSGTGTIAQLMSAVAKKVVGVEIVEEAVEAAKENAELNGLHNCEFIAGDVLKVLDEITDKPDFIILDPPRDGIHPKALPKILDYGVDRIVYVSCKPTSLARDLETFFDRGYRLEKACCVDMFPATANVEVVSLLERMSKRKPDSSINLSLDMEEYYDIIEKETIDRQKNE